MGRAHPTWLVGRFENSVNTKTIIAITGLVISMAVAIAIGGTVNPDKQQSGLTQFLEQKWKVVSSIRDVDPAVVNVLRSRFGRDNRLSDVGEPFNPTDVVDRRPNRRLVLAGHSGSKWFIAYERGGYTHYLKLVIFDTDVQPPRITLSASGEAGTHDFVRGWRLSVSDIETALRNGNLSIDDPIHQYF